MREDPFMCAQVKAGILKYIFSGGEGKQQISSFSWIQTLCFSQGSAQRLYLTKRRGGTFSCELRKRNEGFHSTLILKMLRYSTASVYFLGALAIWQGERCGAFVTLQVVECGFVILPTCLSFPSLLPPCENSSLLSQKQPIGYHHHFHTLAWLAMSLDINTKHFFYTRGP